MGISDEKRQNDASIELYFKSKGGSKFLLRPTLLQKPRTQNYDHKPSTTDTLLDLREKTLAPRNLRFVEPASDSAGIEVRVQRPSNVIFIFRSVAEEDVP